MSAPTKILTGLLMAGLVFTICSSVEAAIESPAEAGPTSAQTGANLYATHCSNCHGQYGDGNGVLSPDLSVALADLRYLSARNNGVFPAGFVQDIIDGRATRSEHGPEDMPVWGAVFTVQQGQHTTDFERARTEVAVQTKIDSIVKYLETIQQSM